MRFDIMTLFPTSVDAMMQESILGRAQRKGLIEIHAHQIRDYTTNRQNQVDDYPYGGGRGAILQCDPLYNCWTAICDEIGAPVHTIFLSPCGAVFDQEKARQLRDSCENIILVCGHYEGVDQRFLDECVDEEISVGDFVLTGGELPAMCIAGAGRPRRRGLLHGREPLGRPARIPAVFPSGRVARAARAGGAAFGKPRDGGPVAQKAGDPAHDALPPGYVRESPLPIQDPRREKIHCGAGG